MIPPPAPTADLGPADRSLERAVRMMRLLGVMALVPVVVGLPGLVRLLATHGPRAAAFFGSTFFFCFFVSGCFFTFATFLSRRRLWAALASLAATATTLLLLLVGLVRLVLILWRIGEPRLLVPIALAGVADLGMVYLIVQLMRALPALRAVTSGHAFEPLMSPAGPRAEQSREPPPVAALPPRAGDPLRPLHLAIRSTRLLGIVSGAFGLVFVIAFGYLNRYQRYRPHFIAMGLLAWFVPGVLFCAAAGMMKQRRRAGAVIAMGVAAAQELIAVAALASSVLLPPVSPVPIVLSVLWIAALAQLIWHLRLSLPLLEQDPERLRGFEIATPQRVLPVEETPAE